MFRSAITVSFLKATSAALGLAFSILLARTLGPNGAGLYFLGLTIALVATEIGKFGLGGTVMRLTATFRAQGDWATVQRILISAIKLAALASLFVTVTTICAWQALRLAELVDPNATYVIYVMAVACLPAAILYLVSESFRGLERPVAFWIWYWPNGLVLTLWMLFAGLLTAWCAAEFLTPELFAATYSLGVWGAMVAGLLHWRNQLANVLNRARGGGSPNLLAPSIPLFIGTVAAVFSSYIPLLTLAASQTLAEVGLFALAQRTASFGSFFLLGVTAASGPLFTRLHTQFKKLELERAIQKSFVAAFLSASPIVLLLALFSRDVMSIYGPQFKEAALCLSAMAVGQLAFSLAGPGITLLTSTGHEERVRNVALVTLVLTLVLSIPLTTELGAVGAAVAVAAVDWIRLPIVLYWVRRSRA